jgi:hypothetical protein
VVGDPVQAPIGNLSELFLVQNPLVEIRRSCRRRLVAALAQPDRQHRPRPSTED